MQHSFDVQAWLRLSTLLIVSSWIMAGSSSCSSDKQSVVAPPVPNFSGNGDNSVSFGNDTVYRLGDGDATDTSCASDLGGLGTAGTAFQFSIEVLNDNTDLEVDFTEICGVDFSNNLVSFSRSNTIIAMDALEPLEAEKSYIFEDMPAGVYVIRVEAGAKFQGPDVDLDDFIVGKLEINANKSVRKLGNPAALAEPKVAEIYESDELIHYTPGDGLGSDSFCASGDDDIQDVDGSTLEWSIQLTDSTTSLIVDIEEICGLDFGTNSLEIFNQSGQLVLRQFFDPTADFLVTPQQVLIPGNYTLRIKSNTDVAGSDRDDFRMKIIRVFHNASSGVLNITAPTP